ncbi:MAG: pentapeptide repeat-containing protein [Nocardioidaceae bacterium]
MSNPQAKRVRRIRPRLDSTLSEDALSRDEVVDDAVINHRHLVAVDLSGARARLVDFESCRFIRCTFSGGDLEKLSIVDTELTGCDLANLRLDHGSFTRVEVLGCRLTGFVAAAAALRHVVFRDCTADFSSFRFDISVAIEFDECSLRQSDFASADLRGATFRRCDLTGAEFSQARLGGAVFVDCTWDGIRGITSFAGATIANSSPIDTLMFSAAMATGLGILLGDPEDLLEID